MLRFDLLFFASPIILSLLLCDACRSDVILINGTSIEPNAMAMVQRLLDSGDLDAARSKLEATVSQERDAEHAELLLAELLTRRGDRIAAREVLEGLAAEEPERFDLRFAYCRLAVQEERWFEALMHASALAEIPVPDHWSDEKRQLAEQQVVLLRANALAGQKKWRLAQRLYEPLTSKQQLAVVRRQALDGLVETSFRLGDIRQCHDALEKLQFEFADITPPAITLALMFSEAGDEAKSRSWFQQGMKTDPANTLLPFARWLLENNDPKLAHALLSEASEDLSAVEDSRKRESIRLFLLGQSARMIGDHKFAAQTFSRLHQSDPTDFLFGNALALSLIESEDESNRARAMQLADANVRQRPNRTEAWSTLGWIQFRLGDYAQAERCFTKAISKGAISRDTAHFLSEFYRAVGQPELAKKFRDASQTAKGPFFYSPEVASD